VALIPSTSDDGDTFAGEQWPRRLHTRRGRRKSMPLWQELPLLLVVAFCLAVLIRTFLMQAFYIWAYYVWRPFLPFNLSPVYTTLEYSR